MNCPCHKCEQREVGCHSKCKKYHQFKKEIIKLRKIEQEEKCYYGYNSERDARIKKRLGY